MTAGPRKNIAASVRARLTDKARARGDDVQLLLRRFAIERLIYRLADSVYRDQFILKGAMLFSLWAPVPYRSTGDLDLLGSQAPDPARFKAIFAEICALSGHDDGVVFDSGGVRAERMREDEDYQGVRVAVMAAIAGAKLPLQIDIGFGDVVTPGAQSVTYPSLLDFPEARLQAYPPETVVAEKLEAMVALGMRNSRMKDFFDLWAIAHTFRFDGAILQQAVAATFARRSTPLPSVTPLALTDAFASDASKQMQWQAFLRRTAIALAPAPLPDLIAAISTFVMPVLVAAHDQTSLNLVWEAGGPWRNATSSSTNT